VTGQNQHVLSDGIAQTRQRTQVDAERVQVRLHGMHAHIGRYARDDLIGGKEQSLLGSMQHGLLKRMPAARDNLEGARAYAKRIAVLDAMIGRGHACRLPQVFMSTTEDCLGDLRRKPMPTIERAMHIGAQIAGRMLQGKTVEILRARHR
jgi:hypothetical protein